MGKLSLVQERMVDLIRATGDTGRIFNAVFVKRTDGVVRYMQARLNVKKGTKGVGLSFNPTEKQLIGCYEMPEGRFRLIPMDGLLAVTVDKLVAARRI